VPALNEYFKPYMFYISLVGLTLILLGYFFTVSLSNYYNTQAKELMLKNKYQEANVLFLKAQSLAPLMDNAFFSHADLLRHGANKLFNVQKTNQAHSLIKLAHVNLDKAEKLNPLRPQTHHIRGLIFQREQPEKAKAEFRKALKLNPKFLFSRIRLAQQLDKENQLKLAIEVLNQGANYHYPVNKIMLEYMSYFSSLVRKSGNLDFALKLEANTKKLIAEIRQKSSN